MFMVTGKSVSVKTVREWYNTFMIDKEDAASLVRIAGIALSIASAIVMFVKPFEYVANTLTVYLLLIAAAIFVMVGQLITIRLNPTGQFNNRHKRQEAWYDFGSIGVVMILFVLLYVIPFVQTHTTWLG